MGWSLRRRLEMRRAEIEDGLFSHDGNFVTARHIANWPHGRATWAYHGEEGVPKSSKKIDAAVCVIGARMVYRMVKEDPQTQEARACWRGLGCG